MMLIAIMWLEIRNKSDPKARSDVCVYEYIYIFVYVYVMCMLCVSFVIRVYC